MFCVVSGKPADCECLREADLLPEGQRGGSAADGNGEPQMSGVVCNEMLTGTLPT